VVVLLGAGPLVTVTVSGDNRGPAVIVIVVEWDSKSCSHQAGGLLMDRLKFLELVKV
jgi:hypothetical protein